MTQENVRKLKAILESDGPLSFTKLFERSGLSRGRFVYARDKAVRERNIAFNDEWGLYYLPGQERLAREIAVAGSIGNTEKLRIVKEAFHDILMIRLTYDKESEPGRWRHARRIAERIRPIMEDLSRADPLFPFSDDLMRLFEDPPDVVSSEGRWQRYCAQVLEYCARRLQ